MLCSELDVGKKFISVRVHRTIFDPSGPLCYVNDQNCTPCPQMRTDGRINTRKNGVNRFLDSQITLLTILRFLKRLLALFLTIVALIQL